MDAGRWFQKSQAKEGERERERANRTEGTYVCAHVVFACSLPSSSSSAFFSSNGHYDERR